jgi:tyrosinase
MKDMNRRDFLSVGLAVSGALALPGIAPTFEVNAQPAASFTRVSVFDPRANLDAYRRGVAVMKQWSVDDPADPRGWIFQAAIHQSFASGPFFNKCEHATWWFLSWHRAYLYFFEHIIRTASGDNSFTLPYWDWDTAARNVLPTAFRESTSKLFDGSRTRAINDGASLLGDINPSDALRAPNFLGTPGRVGFGGIRFPAHAKGLLERPPHDTVHVLVSGNMGDPRTAGLDPIFWLHHANIDRLWDVWLASGRANPPDDAWRKNLINGQASPFVFFDGDKTQVQVTTADFLPGGSRLDYVYDNLRGNSPFFLMDAGFRQQIDKAIAAAQDQEPRVQTQLQKAIEEKRRKLFGTAQMIDITAINNRVAIGSDPVTVRTQIPQASLPSFNMAMELAREDVVSPPVILLHIEDVRSNVPPGVVFRVFLNNPQANASSDPDETNYVGSIALFQSSGHDHDTNSQGKELPGENYSFDITPLVQRLKDQGKWDERAIDVTFVSKGVGGNNKPRGNVTFNRLSLTIEPQ